MSFMEVNLMEGVTPLPLSPLTHPGQVDEGGPDGGHSGTADECLSADVEVTVLNLEGTLRGGSGARRHEKEGGECTQR